MKLASCSPLFLLALFACSDDASGVEPGTDAGMTDAATTEPRPDAAADDFCLTRPALPFCDDFDTTALPSSFVSSTATAAMQIESATDARSKPAVLRVDTDPSRGATIDERLISRPLDAGKKLRSMAFVRVPARPITTDDEPLRVSSFQFTTAAGTYRYSFATNGKGEWFGEELHTPAAGGAPVSKRFPSAVSLPADEWLPVRLEVDAPTPDATTFTVRIGAEHALGPVAIVPVGADLAPTLSVGLDGKSPAQPWTARFDNVTFHFE